MPEIKLNRPQVAANVTTGDITVEENAAAAGTLQESRTESQATNITVAPGKIAVVITNAGNAQVAGQAGQVSTIQVNGRDVFPNGVVSRETFYDRTTNTQKFTPQLVISNPNGATVWIDVTE